MPWWTEFGILLRRDTVLDVCELVWSGKKRPTSTRFVYFIIFRISPILIAGSCCNQKRIATAIILHAIPLATNPNGALLLTWLMDAPELPGRFGLLASRLASHFSHLATHKLACLTILRSRWNWYCIAKAFETHLAAFPVVNQKEEPEAVDAVLDAIFKTPGDQVLHEILQDQVHGSHTITKIVCSDIVEPRRRAELVQACKRVLESMKNTNGYAYRKLLEECGLPIPTSAAPPVQGHNPRFGGRGSPAGRGGHGNGQRYNPGGYNQQLGNGMYNGPGMVPPSPILTGPSMMGVGSGASPNDVNSLINSIHAFQLGQGMANSAGMNPVMMAPGHMGGMQASFGQALSPNMAQNMSPTPTIGSFATPHASLMSPTSDPYNPFNPASVVVSMSSLFALTQFPLLLSSTPRRSCHGDRIPR